MLFKYISCTDLFVHILDMNCPYCVFSCYRDIYLGYIETILCFQSFSNSKAFFAGVAKSWGKSQSAGQPRMALPGSLNHTGA